jgi:predicted nucleotidyltransferase
VSPGLEGEVLVTLARTLKPLTGREVARLVRRGSQAGINRALQRLVQHGIIEGRQVGRASLYSFNQAHVAARAVQGLCELGYELEQRIRAELEEWRIKPLHASLFGSAARADGGLESDIDLFLVFPGEEPGIWRSQVDRLVDAVRQWSGNPLSVAEVSRKELRRLRRDRPEIVKELERDSVTLIEPSFKELMRSAK